MIQLCVIDGGHPPVSLLLFPSLLSTVLILHATGASQERRRLGVRVWRAKLRKEVFLPSPSCGQNTHSTVGCTSITLHHRPSFPHVLLSGTVVHYISSEHAAQNTAPPNPTQPNPPFHAPLQPQHPTSLRPNPWQNHSCISY